MILSLRKTSSPLGLSAQYLRLQRVCLRSPPLLRHPPLHISTLHPPPSPSRSDVSNPHQVFRRSVLKVVEQKAKSISALGVALILMAPFLWKEVQSSVTARLPIQQTPISEHASDYPFRASRCGGSAGRWTSEEGDSNRPENRDGNIISDLSYFTFVWWAIWLTGWLNGFTSGQSKLLMQPKCILSPKFLNPPTWMLVVLLVYLLIPVLDFRWCFILVAFWWSCLWFQVIDNQPGIVCSVHSFGILDGVATTAWLVPS